MHGYRAASYSIGAETLWALDELLDAGYRYSSSIYPIRHDLYGMPEAPRFPFRHGGDGILEIPISTARVFGQNFPSGGGGYFRLMPYALFRAAVRRIHGRDRKPCVFFFHPWEVDPEQPRQEFVGFKSRFRHYLNLDRMEARLDRLLSDFRWGPHGPRLSHGGGAVSTAVAPMIRASRLESGDEARWDAFVASCPDATFFHRAGWKRVMEEVFGHEAFFLMAESEQGIEAVLPLGRVRGLFGDALISVPFGVYGGVAAQSEEAAELLTAEAVSIAENLGVDYLEMRNRRLRGDWPTKELYVTFRKEILPEPDDNMKAIPRKQRAMVRKGHQGGARGLHRRRHLSVLSRLCDEREEPRHAGLSEALLPDASRRLRRRRRGHDDHEGRRTRRERAVVLLP